MASEDLKRLTLHDAHAEAGARFAPFAGYEMPVRYGTIIDEHTATRERAGLFDVSHMGQVFLRGEGAIAAANHLVTNNVLALPVGRALYTAMCDESGGIIDDLIVYHLADNEVLICVNAACRAKDVAWMRDHLLEGAELHDESDDYCQLAIQGPLAREIALPLMGEEAADLATFGVARTRVADRAIIAARTGYTGEDGFEFYVPSADAPAVYSALMEAGTPRGMLPVGLGARDTLRLEARLLLYGSDMNIDTNPYEAGLGWVVKLDSAPFIGSDALASIKAEGPKRRLRGFVLRERGVLRGGYPIYDGDRQIGELTSGSVAPTLDGVSVGLGYVDADAAGLDNAEIEIRGRRVPVEMTRKPFYRRQD